jgi:hypothetical protein
MLNRRMVWLLQLAVITLLLGLQMFDFDRRILLGLAALCFAVTALRWRSITDWVTRLWISFGLVELFVPFLWSCLNVVRGQTYDVEHPSSSNSAIYWKVVEAQNILLPWLALLIPILFLIILAINRKVSTGQSAANV